MLDRAARLRVVESHLTAAAETLRETGYPNEVSLLWRLVEVVRSHRTNAEKRGWG